MKKNICLIIYSVVFVLMGVSDIQASYGKKRGGHGHGGGHRHGGGGYGWCKYRQKNKGKGFRGHQNVSKQYQYIKTWVDQKVAEAAKGGKSTVSLADLKKMFNADKPSKDAWQKVAKAAVAARAKKIADAITANAKSGKLTQADIQKAVAAELEKQDQKFLKSPQAQHYCGWVWGKKGQDEPEDIKDAMAGTKPWRRHGGHGGHGGKRRGHGPGGKRHGHGPAGSGGRGHGQRLHKKSGQKPPQKS